MHCYICLNCSLKRALEPTFIFWKVKKKEKDVVHPLMPKFVDGLLLSWPSDDGIAHSCFPIQWEWYCSFGGVIHSAKCRILLYDTFHVSLLACSFNCFSSIYIFKQNLHVIKKAYQGGPFREVQSTDFELIHISYKFE